MKAKKVLELEKRITGKKILIDSNIIIYLTDTIQPYDKLSKSIFEIVESGGASAVLSIISIAEVMQGPIRKGNRQSAEDVKNYLLNFPNTFCQEITPTVLEHIGMDNKIKWSTLRTLDSLIIASGLENSVDLFISNDDHFNRAIPHDLMLSFDL